MASKRTRDEDSIVVNRRARFDYDISETIEAGIALQGTEVKSLRAGKASIAEAYAKVMDGEAWLLQATIPEYEFGNRMNHDPTRRRKLLVHRGEIEEMAQFTQELGRTLVPMKLYWKDGRVKVLIGLGRGKSLHDKRGDLAKKDAERAVQRALAERRRR